MVTYFKLKLWCEYIIPIAFLAIIVIGYVVLLIYSWILDKIEKHNQKKEG